MERDLEAYASREIMRLYGKHFIKLKYLYAISII